MTTSAIWDQVGQEPDPPSPSVQDKPDYESDGARLLAARRRAVLSAAELADKAGVCMDSIYRLERGEITRPHPSSMRALASALDVEPIQIFRDAINGTHSSKQGRGR